MAIYDTDSAVTVQAGENTRTVTITNFHPELGARYYFWIKLTNPADNVYESDWSDDFDFTYLVSGMDTEYLARRICTGNSADDVNSFEGSNGELYAQVGWDQLKVNGQWYFFYNPRYKLEISFKSLDENTGTAYFYATATAGYYIENGMAVPLPAEIDASNLELNPETNYWRCK